MTDDLETIQLRDGYRARAHTRPTHGQMKRYYKSFRGKSEDDMLDMQGELILLLVDEWTAPGGAVLPLSREGIEGTPQSVVTELTDKLADYLGDVRSVADKIAAIGAELDEDDPLKPLIEAFVVDLGNA